MRLKYCLKPTCTKLFWARSFHSQIQGKHISTSMEENPVKRSHSLDPQMPHDASDCSLISSCTFKWSPNQISNLDMEENKTYNEVLGTRDAISIVIDLIIQSIRWFCSTDLCLLQVFQSSSPTICSSCGKKQNGSIVVFHKSESRSLWIHGLLGLGPLSWSKGDWATIYQLQTITCLLHNILQNLYRFSPKSLWPYKRGALLCLWWVVLQVARLTSTLNGVCQYRNLDLIR